MEDKSQAEAFFSDPFGAETEDTANYEKVEIARDTVAVQQLLTHVPDNVIKCDHKKQVPYVEQFKGVCLFADISGFTALCEKYSSLSDTDGSGACGTDQLSATLNNYLGKIVECILRNGGDVLKFAGDALFAVWKMEDTRSRIAPLVNSAIMCSLSIQEECDNHMTDVGVLLRVKTAVAIGVFYVTYVGLYDSKQFDMSGPAIDDANAAEAWAQPGSVVLSQLAWDNCEQALFIYEIIEDGHHYKVLGVKQQHVTTPCKPTSISYLLGSMSGVLTAHSMRLTAPVIAKRALGPHLGDFYEKFFPYWKPPKIFCNTRRKDMIIDKVKVSSGIAGLMTYDPDARLLEYSKLTDQEVDDLRAYVPKPVLYKIDHHQDLEWLSEMRQVSVLFVNMALPYNVFEAAQAVQKAYEVIYETVRRLKGNLNKVFSFDKGCTFVVIFGLPGDKHDDDPARAVTAGYRIMESLRTILEITNESIGITTGRAFCGVVGHLDRHEYTVIGSKVNMAARLMMNFPSIVSCDEETYKAAITKLNKQDFEALPPKSLKGIADPGVIREYTKDHDRILEEDDEYDYPILGREKEKMVFRELLYNIKAEDSHLDSKGKFLLIVGDTGIGKTRMLEEFMDIAENQDFRMDFVEADMAHAQTPFYIVQNLITTLLHLEGCTCASEREAKILNYIQNEELKTELCLVNDLLGTHAPGHAKLIHMDDNTVAEHQHLLLFEIVHQVVLKEPCIFAIENGHFIDNESWNFLEDLVSDSHAVLIMTMKPLNTVPNLPESATRLISANQTIKMTLDGLSADLMIDMACQFLDVTCIPRDLETIIREKSHGVASWCEQLVKDMLSSNNIKVVSDKDVVIQEESQIPSESTNRSDSKLLASSRPLSPAIPSEGKTTNTPRMAADSVDKDQPSCSDPALTRVPSSATTMANLQAFRRKSIALVKTLTALRRASVAVATIEEEEDSSDASGSDEIDKHETDDKKWKSVKFEDGNIDDEIFTGDDAIPLEKPPVPQVQTTQNEWPAECREKGSRVLTPISRYFLPPDYFVYASADALVPDIHNMCIVTPGQDLTKIPVPESLREMVLARFDRLPPLEKVVLKCSSILGDCFPSDLVAAIVPKSAAAQVDLTLYHLLKERILECATLAHQHQNAHNHHGFLDTTHSHTQHHHHHHHHHITNTVSDMVPCGCYGEEGTKIVNLTRFLTKNKLKKNCLYLKFSNNCVQETTYALWLKNQREGLHQKTAMHLESQAHKCRSCGGGAFLPYSKKSDQESSRGRTTTMGSGRSGVHMRSEAARRRSSRLIREKVQEQGAFISRVTDRKVTVAQDTVETGTRRRTVRDDVMMMEVNLKAEHEKVQRDQRKLHTPQHSVAPVLVTAADVDARTYSGQKTPLELVEKTQTVSEIAESTCSAAGSDSELELQSPAATFEGVNLSKCECAYILASVFPQLVMHWSAAGNKLKTFRYLTESGAAALATGNNMQALSYLHDVQAMLLKDNQNFEANSEEKARVESLVGQALLGMNRLDAAIIHLNTALRELGVRQPVTKWQIFLRTYIELCRQAMTNTMLSFSVRNRSDYEGIYKEQTRCFFHISHVYHAEGRHRESFMAALQELNSAEKIGDGNFHELLSAYTSVIECSGLLSWAKYAEKLEGIAIERCKQESSIFTPDDMIAISNFYSVVSTFRLGRAYLQAASTAGFEALSRANKLNDHMLKINCIPSLAQCLILMSRVDECHDVLKELNYAAKEKDELHGRALYFCSCFDLILETGHALETLDDCLQFTIQTTVDPRLTWDLIVKYYLNASLLLWHARCENWEQAARVLLTVKAVQPREFEVVMAGRAFVKIVEYYLLMFGRNHEVESLKKSCKKALKRLSKICKRFLVLKPRYYHLKAYYSLLSGKQCRARTRLLPRCIELSTKMGMLMETEWAILSKHEWFDKKSNSTFTYNGQVKFPLPKLENP